MKFPDASGVPVNMLPISDGSAFDQLKRLVDTEGDNLAGPDWLGMLAAIGIVKGKPFAPDAHTREILDRAAKTGHKTSRVIGFEEVVGGLLYLIYPDRHWSNPMADGTPGKPFGEKNLSWMNVVLLLATTFQAAHVCGAQVPDTRDAKHVKSRALNGTVCLSCLLAQSTAGAFVSVSFFLALPRIARVCFPQSRHRPFLQSFQLYVRPPPSY